MKNTLFILVVLFAACSCSRREKSVPRPNAFPRIEIYDSVYKPLPGFPIKFEVNSGTVSKHVEGHTHEWWDVRYPKYNAVMHLSVLPVLTSFEDEIVNSRIERMMMNMGEAKTAQEEFMSADSVFRVLLFHEPGFTPTPVQFMALGDGYIITGTFRFNSLEILPDSVAPVVRSVVRDIRHSFAVK